MSKKIIVFCFLICFFVNIFPLTVQAAKSTKSMKVIDTDKDGLADNLEKDIYHTDIANPDSDNDGYQDGEEVSNNYDPNSNDSSQLTKKIAVTIKDQTLRYYLGPYQVGSFKISSGIKNHPTPSGSFLIDKKLDTHVYKGKGYFYPNTKWNMRFLYHQEGSYYIHGAYWHNRFGHPASHGCINVSYKNMETLYNWTPVGTLVEIN